jgi:dipeptide/tripeptide permease
MSTHQDNDASGRRSRSSSVCSRTSQRSHGEDDSSLNDSMQDVELEVSPDLNQAPPPEYSVDKKDILHQIKLQMKTQRQQKRQEKIESTTQSFRRMNPVVLCILMTEAAERFAYYGFRASLVLYFTQELAFDDSAAISLFAYSTFLANFTPLCGALLSDGALGRFKTIVSFGFIYWVGLIVLTHAAFLTHETVQELNIKRIVTLVGLALICTGTGGIKPCVSIFGADQVSIEDDSSYEDEDDEEDIGADVVGATSGSKDKDTPTSEASPASSSNDSKKSEEQDKVRTFFSFFSMCINLGAIASFVIIPTIKGRFGFGVAFLFPTAFMCLAVILFLSQRHKYVYRSHNPHGSSLYTTFRLCIWLLHNNIWMYYPLVASCFPCLKPGPVPLQRLVPTSSGSTVGGESATAPPTKSKKNNNEEPMKGDTEVTVDVENARDDEEEASSISSVSMSMRSRSLSASGDIDGERSLSIDANSRQGARDGDDFCPASPSKRKVKVNWDEEALKQQEEEDKGGLHRSAASNMALSATTSLQTTDRYLAQQLSDAARALNVVPVLAMLPVFWMLYDLQGSVWTLQASRMDLHGFMQPEQINVLNPIGLFVLIPVFDKIVYPALSKRGYDISPLRRMGWGMILVAVAFFISGIVEYIIAYRIVNRLSPISVTWQIPQICCMVVAEIFISVTGLEFAYSVSPDRLKSFVMAAYLMTIAKGDFWGGVLYSTVFRDMNQAVVLHIFAMMMLGNLACYGYVVRSWELRHGLVSLDLFDKVLETESQRPWNQAIQGSTPPSSDKRQRGRGRWRRRGKVTTSTDQKTKKKESTSTERKTKKKESTSTEQKTKKKAQKPPKQSEKKKPTEKAR